MTRWTDGEFPTENLKPRDYLALFSSPSSKVRSLIIAEIEKPFPVQVEKYITDLVRDSDFFIARDALKKIIEFNIWGKEVKIAVLEGIKNNLFYENFLELAFKILEKAKEQDLLEKIIINLFTLSPELRFISIEFLKNTQSEYCIKEFLKLINDRNPDVRYYAAIALGAIGNGSVIPDLAKLLNDLEHVRSVKQKNIQTNTVTVSHGAAEGLDRIGSSPAKDALDKWKKKNNLM